MRHIGEFEIVSGKIIITDPCYAQDGICQLSNRKAKRGVWVASIEVHDGSVSVLHAHHIDHEGDLPNISIGTIGVDSGMAGIYDMEKYKDQTLISLNDIQEMKNKNDDTYDEDFVNRDPWYAYNCFQVSDNSAGIIPFGTVSASGAGDGDYFVRGKYVEKELVAIDVIFEDHSACNLDYEGEEYANEVCTGFPEEE